MITHISLLGENGVSRCCFFHSGAAFVSCDVWHLAGLHSTYLTCSSECYLSVWVTAYSCPRIDAGRWGGDHNLWCCGYANAKVEKNGGVSTKCGVSSSFGRRKKFWGNSTTSSTYAQALSLHTGSSSPTTGAQHWATSSCFLAYEDLLVSWCDWLGAVYVEETLEDTSWGFFLKWARPTLRVFIWYYYNMTSQRGALTE